MQSRRYQIFFIFAIMKKLFILLVCIVSVSISAQNLKKFYIQAAHESGQLFFIFPQKMKVSQATNKLKVSKLLYDYTHLTSEDEVSMLSTVIVNEPLTLEAVRINFSDGVEEEYKLEKIYVKPKSSKWQYRVRATIPLEKIKKMYSSNQPFSITYLSADGKQEIRYKDNQSKWNKIYPKFKKVLYIVDSNK